MIWVTFNVIDTKDRMDRLYNVQRIEQEAIMKMLEDLKALSNEDTTKLIVPPDTIRVRIYGNSDGWNI